MIWIVLAVLAWISCGVISGMGIYAFNQNEWPIIAAESRTRDRVQSWFAVVLGPIGLFAGLMVYEGFRHGLKRFW